MGNGFLDGLGGLVKGLSGFMPQDDPEVKVMNAQMKLEELKAQEESAYAEIGRLAIADHPGLYSKQQERIRLLQADIQDVMAKLERAQSEKEESDRAAQLADDSRTCPECGTYNPEGVGFCQECGAKLGSCSVCPNCGAHLGPGVRFCGVCGTKTVG